MGKINFGRVLLGGLVAGLLLNIGEWVLNGIVLPSNTGVLKEVRVPEPAQNSCCRRAAPFVLGIVMVLLGPPSGHGLARSKRDHRQPVSLG